MANIVLDFLHNYQTGERRETEPANTYQYDEGHVLEAVLPEVITSCEIHYWIRGMEEAEAYTPTSITPNSDGSCTVLGNIPNSYFETSGELRIYIVVTDGTASITTYEGKLHIAQRAMPDDYVDDDPDNEAVQVIAAARGYAETSEAWAVGQINGEDVPSTADQYQNNAAYYAGQAASAASSAAAQASLAPAYDSTSTYEVGDYCLYSGQLYECTTAISTAEAWTAAHWTAVTVGGELSDLKEDFHDVIENGFLPNDYAWQRGGLSSGEITNQPYRLVMTDAVSVSVDFVVKNINPNYKYGVHWTKNGVTTDSGWIGVNDGYFFRVPADSSFRIVIAKVTENYISLSDAEVTEMSKIIVCQTNLYDNYKKVASNEQASLFGIVSFDYTDFIIGTYYDSGTYYKDPSRVCNKTKMSFPFDTILSPDGGYRIAVHLLDSQGNVDVNIPYTTADVAIPKDTDFDIIIDNGSGSGTANVPLYVSHVTYKTPIIMSINNLQEIGTHEYEGVNVKPQKHGFNTSQLAWSYSAPTTSGTFTPQAMAYSNGVVFKCWKDDLIQLYSFEDGTKIAEYAITSEHGDCMDFSNEYYNADDEFPLAYFTSDTSPLKVYVNRLTRSSGTLVRTLQFSVESAGYYAGHAVDAVNNRLITLGYSENNFETDTNGTNLMICAVWDLNNLAQNQDSTYTPTLLKSFTLPFMICTQDQCYYNNKMFVISSNWRNTSTVIYVVDIGEESIVATLSDIPYKTYETEGVFWVGSDMYVNGNGITKYSFV